MNISSIDTQTHLYSEFELLFSTQLVPLENQIPVIAKGVALYAQAFFDRLSMQEQKKVTDFFEEWGNLREMKVRSILPTMTLNKVNVLKELVQQLPGCTILDMGEWSMRPLYLFKITSGQKDDVQIDEDEFNKLVAMQKSNSISVIAISQSSWGSLNDWVAVN